MVLSAADTKANILRRRLTASVTAPLLKQQQEAQQELERQQQQVARVRHDLNDLLCAQRKVGFNVSKATRCSTSSTLGRLADREKYMTPKQLKHQLHLQFGLKLPAAEFAALFAHFDAKGEGKIESALFVRSARQWEQQRGLAAT